jgi:SMI1 / KNR4 family (SUKH-1)
METMTTTQAASIEKLVRFFESTGTNRGTGAKTDDITRFAQNADLLLPKDLATFLEVSNGTNGDYAPGMVCLWSLDQYRRLDSELNSQKHDSTALIHSAYQATPPNANEYFVFADFMHESKLYAIRLAESSQKGEVIILDGDAPRVVSRSFSEFLEQLMSNPSAIGAESD